MVAPLLALKQVLRGHHFSVMQEKRWRSCNDYSCGNITLKNVKGPPTFQELVADIFWKKPLMRFTSSPGQEMYSTIHL